MDQGCHGLWEALELETVTSCHYLLLFGNFEIKFRSLSLMVGFEFFSHSLLGSLLCDLREVSSVLLLKIYIQN